MRKTRKLHINGTVWEYVIGHSFVAIFSPQRLDVPFHTLIGWSVEKTDRAVQHKNLGIEPSDVRKYIIDNLLGGL